MMTDCRVAPFFRVKIRLTAQVFKTGDPGPATGEKVKLSKLVAWSSRRTAMAPTIVTTFHEQRARVRRNPRLWASAALE